MMIALPLTALAVISGALHVRAEYRGTRRQVYFFKPLTVLCIFAIALTIPGAPVGRYRAAVLAGLICSIAGDVFLMIPADRFLPGVASFLLAHLAYIAAFTDGVPFGAEPLWLIPFAVLGAAMLVLLWPRLGAMRGPVVVYLAVIVAMAWQAAGRAVTLGSHSALLAAAGASLFVISDTALALNRFRRPFRTAQAVILPTYYAAQLLIAWSVGG